MNTVSDQDAELLRFITQALASETGRRPSTRTGGRFRPRADTTATTNAILEIVRGYTSTINQYNRNIDRALTLLETDLYQRISERTGVEEVEQPTRPTRERPRPSNNHHTMDFTFWLNPFSLYRRATDSTATVGLTPEQIESVTRERTYRSADWPENHVCPISLDDFVEGESILELRECRHVFKPAELQRWLERHDCCPVCRRNVHPPAATETDDTPPPLEPAVRDEPVATSTANSRPTAGVEYSYVIENPFSTDSRWSRRW
jgi:hypothetical protein